MQFYSVVYGNNIGYIFHIFFLSINQPIFFLLYIRVNSYNRRKNMKKNAQRQRGRKKKKVSKMTIKPEHMTALVYFAVLIMSFTTSMAMWSFQLTRSHGVLQTTLSSPSITSRKCYTGESCNITSRKCHTERDRITSALFRVGETWGWDRYFRIYCHPFSISSFLPWSVYSSADTYLPTCLFIY